MLSDEQRKRIGEKRKEFEQVSLSLDMPSQIGSWFENISFNASFIKDDETYNIHSRLHKLYPTISGSRYVPALTYRIESREAAASDNIKYATESLKLENETVYFFYINYPPVLKLYVNDIAHHVDELLQEDVCIISTDFNRIIFRSRYNEWSWGSHCHYPELYRTDKARLYVYWARSGTWQMRRIFSAVAQEIEAGFHEDDLEKAEEAFYDSRADTGRYLIVGREMWIEVLFERHEGYFGWHCYTYDKGVVHEWRPRFKQLAAASK